MRHSFLNYFKNNSKNINYSDIFLKKNRVNCFQNASLVTNKAYLPLPPYQINYSEKDLAKLSKEKKFNIKMENLKTNFEQPQYVDTYQFGKAISHAKIARQYHRFSLGHYKHKKNSIDSYYSSLNVNQANLRWKNAFLGFSIWSFSGIKNINISGFRSLALTIGKLVFSGFISPSWGAKYLDIPASVTMGLYSEGIPIFPSVCKNAPPYHELINEHYQIKKLEKLLKQYQKNRSIQEIDKLKQKINNRKILLKKNVNLQNDNLKYALKGNWRSAARIGTLGAIIGLIISSGGISLAANGIIMGVGHFIYALACGIDTDVQNNYTIWLNLKRTNFFYANISAQKIDKILNEIDAIAANIINKKLDKKQIEQDLDKISNIIDPDKVRKSWINSNDILKGMIKEIYTHEASLLTKDINGLIDDKISLNHKNIGELETLVKEIYLFEENRLTELNSDGIIGKCLNSKFYLNCKAVRASQHATNNWYGQAAKNFGTSNISTALNAVGETAYYSPLHEINQNAGNGIFTAGKTSAGFSAAAVRSLSSSKRKETKKIFELDLGEIKTKKLSSSQLDLDVNYYLQNAPHLSKNIKSSKHINHIKAKLIDIDYAINSQGRKIITALNFEIFDSKINQIQKLSIPVIDYSPQSNQFNPITNRYKNLAKASWVSTKAAYSIPHDVFILNRGKI